MGRKGIRKIILVGILLGSLWIASFVVSAGNGTSNSNNVQNALEESAGKTETNHKSKETSSEADSKEVILSLVAIAGVGGAVAVLLSIMYKIYLAKKVNAMPVLYLKQKETTFDEHKK